MRKEADIFIATIMRPQGETGVQTHFNTCIEFAERAGVSVELLTPFGANKTLVYLMFGPRKLVQYLNTELGIWWYRYWHYILLRNQIFKRLYDHPRKAVVYAQDPLSARAALDLKDRGWPIEVVLIVHFNISQAIEWAEKGDIAVEGWLYKHIVRFESQVLPRVDRLLFPSRFIQQQIVERIPDVAKVPSWVVPNFLTPEHDGVQKVTTTLSGDIITIGTLEPRKNQQFILQALAHAHRLGHPYQLTIVGDGSLRRNLKVLVSQLKLEGYVEFTGYLPNAARLLCRHRICVHAARIENLSILLLEALAAGKPILAAPVGGVPEIFTHGVEGFYWDLDDPGRAAESLIEILENKALYEQMSEAARSRYESHFSSEVVGARWLGAVLGSD